MSPIKTKILNRLLPFMEGEGYRFSKSSTSFSRRAGELEYRIRLRFDGRGGLSLLTDIEMDVCVPKYNRLIKQLVGSISNSMISESLNYWTFDHEIVPVPYGQEALNLANNMDLKALAELPFDEKYPAQRIVNTAEATKQLIEEFVPPFFNKIETLDDIYHRYCEAPEAESNPMKIYRYRRRMRANHLRVLYFLLLANDLDRPIPEVLYKFKHFYNDMNASFGYLGKTQLLKENLRELGIDYRPK